MALKILTLIATVASFGSGKRRRKRKKQLSSWKRRKKKTRWNTSKNVNALIGQCNTFTHKHMIWCGEVNCLHTQHNFYFFCCCCCYSFLSTFNVRSLTSLFIACYGRKNSYRWFGIAYILFYASIYTIFFYSSFHKLIRLESCQLFAISCL